MFIAKKEELEKYGFRFTAGSKGYEIAFSEIDKRLIVFEELNQDEYGLHRIITKNGEHYDEIRLSETDRFDKIKNLEELLNL